MSSEDIELVQRCPRDDCESILLHDKFHPPGVLTCPVHGGPMFMADKIQLITEPVSAASAASTTSSHKMLRRPQVHTELEAMGSWLARLASDRRLRHHIYRDMSGVLPVVLTIENHGPESIDINFYFDATSGQLVDVKARVDDKDAR